MANWLMTCLLCAVAPGEPAAADTVDVRIGIVAFEDFRAEQNRFSALLGELSRRDPKLRFQIAVGTYGDVLHWIRRRQVDIAVLSPGVFAELLGSQLRISSQQTFEYLATVNLPPASSPWAGEDRRKAGVYDWYRPACLVADTSPLKSIDDLRRLTAKGQAEFVFVHPLSASGHRAAEFALRKAGIETAESVTRYSFSHSESIRLLSSSHPNRPRVAFVFDDATADNAALSRSVRRLDFPELDSLQIPNDVVIAVEGFRHADRFRDLLLDLADTEGRPRFVALTDWKRRYRLLRDWWSDASFRADDGASQLITLDEIGQTLLHHARSQPRPPRLALVLSGGGAKCSYQVGAVAALEEKLTELRKQNPNSGLDIALVVGTSGGAINSLPIAMGISQTKEGRRGFRRTWAELDQREIVRPSRIVRANIGLWFALFQTMCVVWVVRLFVRQPERRGLPFAIVYTSLAAIEIIIGYVSLSPWAWLGTNHWWHHAWLWIGFGVRASAWSLLGLGVAALLMEAVRAKRGRHISIPSWLTWSTLAAGLLGLPLLQIITVASIEETLSGGQGMEHAVAEKFPRLIDAHLEQQGQPPLDLEGTVMDADRLQATSRQIVERQLMQRDLVMTGSCLSQTSDDLPSDIYFYLPADSDSADPPFGNRGISLLQRPSILLDVMLGSGSIFPIFPSRRVNGVPNPDDSIELIDGGFAHNSPVEAAVLWGATHIVLIEATPRRRVERTNFLQNASASFSHLYQQAQLLDARSRERVVVFSLAPDPPHMCVLDFSDNLIADSIDRGYHDAARTSADGPPRFKKEPGLPVFLKVVTGAE
ncbi:MAG: PhnD/SsuA/transferrin family substrate-binding protein [Planctomycetaceae bacterium]|jgi:predicted acylesterase/phospholipase RssA|nr:PhnD/SsuA/transferrin family substrate-binding protein [Planctomycetaceae bacterium]MBT6485678.1 PhnD/SsuA/transferrin family substrate-binding protein [Planctomycetaceae bacterium]MBT6497713.1 PhnD/SsuA/transferrin family substrate-binding protein [Planctomycetaceae bacterium]